MEKGAMLGDRISSILGRGSPRSSIVSSASLAVVCLFYVYTVGTYLQVRIYPLIDRVTHYIPFDLYVVNEYVDHVVIGSLLILWLAFSVKRIKAGYVAIGAFAALLAAAAATNNDPVLDGIALSALPAMVALLIYSRYSKRILNNDSTLWINYLAIVGIVIGIVSFGFAVSTIATDNAAGYPIERNYAYGVFLLFSSASPILLLLLITCFPVKLLIDFVAARLRKLQDLDTKDIVISTRSKGIYLALFVLLSIIIAVIPHLGTLNPDNRPVGVDTHFYVDWVGALNNSTSAQDFLYQAFVQQRGGDRPVSLIFIYALHQVTGADLTSVVEFTPLILGPALVLAVYFLTRELTSNNVTSLLAAFLTAISFHTLIGIYAGFYANWLALVVGYISLIFLFRYLRKGDQRNIALYLVLTVLTLFTHIYTWSIIALASGIFLAVTIAIRKYQLLYTKKRVVFLLVMLLFTVAIDVGRAVLTGSSGGIERDFEVAENKVGPEQFVLRWNNLSYTTTTYVGGQLANFIILALGVYWLVKADKKELTSLFLIAFFSIGILPFLFGEWIIQTRVFYNIPFQIPAAIALSAIIHQSRGALKSLPIYVWLITMGLIAVSNFYLITPTDILP